MSQLPPSHHTLTEPCTDAHTQEHRSHPPSPPEHLIETPITIVNKLGLHARAAAKLVEVASQFNATCQLRRGEHIADCKSIMSLLILAASQHTRLTLCTQGSDAQDADAAIVQLIQGRFDENE